MTPTSTQAPMKINIASNILFFENRLVKACKQTVFRNDSVKRFLSLIPLLHYRRKDARPVRLFSTLENYKQRRGDSCSPSEPDPAGHSKYQVPLNCLATDRGFSGFAYQPYQPRLTKKETCTPLQVIQTSFFVQWVNPSIANH